MESTENNFSAVRIKGIYSPIKMKHDKSVIILDGNKIKEVRDDVPKDIPLKYDFEGYAIPGLVDAHSHASIRPWEGDQIRQLGIDRTTATVRAVNNLEQDLKSGTTTMRLMGEEDFLDIRLSEAEKAGELLSPRLLPSGIHLTPTGGHALVKTSTDGKNEIRKRIRENFNQGATHTKFFATGGISSEGDDLGASLYSREEIRTIVEETHRKGKHVAVHAHGGEGFRLSMEEGVDTIEHGSLFGEEEIEIMKGSDRYLVGNFAIFFHPEGIEKGDSDNPSIINKLLEARKGRKEVWASILESDINVTIGTDSMHGYMYYEIEKLNEFGTTPEKAINAATIDAAKCVRMEDKVGSIEKGKYADFVILKKNPIEDIQTLKEPLAVFKDGKKIS